MTQRRNPLTSPKAGLAARKLNAPVVIVMGVAASGKSTIAALLAERLSLPFVEGDDLHESAAMHQMAEGHALTEVQRSHWWFACTTNSSAWHPKGSCARARHSPDLLETSWWLESRGPGSSGYMGNRSSSAAGSFDAWTTRWEKACSLHSSTPSSRPPTHYASMPSAHQTSWSTRSWPG